MRAVLCCLIALAAGAHGAESAVASAEAVPLRLGITQTLLDSGMCDASGAVAVNSNLFVVACDEDNILRVYHSDQSGPPVDQFDFSVFLELTGKSPETDLEGAARIGDRVFWIGSHGANKNAKDRPNRCRFFATDIGMAGGRVTLTPAGKPCKRLLEDLAADSRFDQFNLRAASHIAPKEPGALNIEGLAATPEGHLLIGFRNPVPAAKALLIPLLNPNDVIRGKSAKFDAPLLLDLGGLGIRDIGWHAGNYLIIAGPWHGGHPFRLYRWPGPGRDPELLHIKFPEDAHPETVVIFPQLGLDRFQILSDDGTVPIDGCACKLLENANRRAFRNFRVEPR